MTLCFLASQKSHVLKVGSSLSNTAHWCALVWNEHKLLFVYIKEFVPPLLSA